ncbi:hypothetical protein BC937DRAFT_92600 [Endogone sp. FLAS-F59071]|nr:hypothetical protein BC937DRAFT_92600 [Endogone sp. FLAS-F59071]|eukprot:RUS21483.1 hypothetical protein BC937DRAFT_92600 [Endogone sp. FLAS-F59071]
MNWQSQHREKKNYYSGKQPSRQQRMDERLRQKKERLKRLKEKQAELQQQAKRQQPSAFDLLTNVLNSTDQVGQLAIERAHGQIITIAATLPPTQSTRQSPLSAVHTVPQFKGPVVNSHCTNDSRLVDKDIDKDMADVILTGAKELELTPTVKTYAPLSDAAVASSAKHISIEPVQTFKLPSLDLHKEDSIARLSGEAKKESPSLSPNMDVGGDPRDRVMPYTSTKDFSLDKNVQKAQWPLSKEYHETDSRSQPILDKNDEQLSRPPNNNQQDTNAQDFEEDSLSSYSSSSSFSSWNSEGEHSRHRQGRRNIDDSYRSSQSDRAKVNNKRRLSLTPDRSSRVRLRCLSRSRSRDRSRGSIQSFDRSPSPCSDEVDEFGRVKRRRRKFYVQRSDGNRMSDEDEEGIITESDSGSDGAYRRWQGEYERNQSKRSSEQDERRRKSGRRRKTDDPYAAAARYIDTEFFATKIYVGELQNVTEKQLRTAFERFGEIKLVKMVEGKDFAFITFDRKDQALKAIQHMNGNVLGNRPIKVNRAKIPERNRVGFGNVPWQDEDGILAKESESLDISPRLTNVTLQNRVTLSHAVQTRQLPISLDAPGGPDSFALVSSALLPMDPSTVPLLDPRFAGRERKVLSYDDL